MKIFLDTADRSLIKEWLPTGLVDGITTNPSNLSKEGKNTREILLEICSLVSGDVSIEVVEKSPEAVYKQAREIAALAKNVVVKIPFSQTYLPVIKKLVTEKIAINVTLVFGVLQALLVAKLGVRYISPFVGRWEEIDIDGISILGEIKDVIDNYGFSSEILAASLRTLMHVHQAALLGVDIATVHPTLLSNVMNHPLTSRGIEKFDEDWGKLGKPNLLE